MAARETAILDKQLYLSYLEGWYWVLEISVAGCDVQRPTVWEG